MWQGLCQESGEALIRLLAKSASRSGSAASAASLYSAKVVNAANLLAPKTQDDLNPELTLKLQVLLDRAHFSPGQIDGHMGGNTLKAFAALRIAAHLIGNRFVGASVGGRSIKGAITSPILFDMSEATVTSSITNEAVQVLS